MIRNWVITSSSFCDKIWCKNQQFHRSEQNAVKYVFFLSYVRSYQFCKLLFSDFLKISGNLINYIFEKYIQMQY